MPFPELQPHLTTANILLTIRKNMEKSSPALQDSCITWDSSPLFQVRPIILSFMSFWDTATYFNSWNFPGRINRSARCPWQDTEGMCQGKWKHGWAIQKAGISLTWCVRDWDEPHSCQRRILDITSGPLGLTFQVNVSLMYLSTILNRIFNTTEFMLQEAWVDLSHNLLLPLKLWNYHEASGLSNTYWWFFSSHT